MYTRSWRDPIPGSTLNDIYYKPEWVSQPSIKCNFIDTYIYLG